MDAQAMLSQWREAVDQKVDQIIGLLGAAAGRDYIGEDVSQLEHGLQCAALAREAKATDALVLAALLHDIGHFCDDDAEPMADLGSRFHEEIGARYLAQLGFSPEVQDLVRGHVEAKRYLVGKHPHYRETMSQASQKTLELQGGAMSEEEMARFEASAAFKDKLRLRKWDDTGKREELEVPGVESYRNLLCQHLRAHTPIDLGEDSLAFWRDHGYLHLQGFFEEGEAAQLQQWTRQLEQWPESPGKWMKYFETTAQQPRQLCRVENFLPYHEGFHQLLCGERIIGLLSQLMAEPALLYKEKINFKLPGGSGFGAHQDAPAFTTFGQSYHITLMISIDASTRENGCLEVVAGHHDRGLLDQAPDGTLAEHVTEALEWVPVETKPGDILLFDSYIPHRSQANRSSRSRRALYITYNKAAEGDFRQQYFEHKRAHFPPECEREPGKDYSKAERLYNLGNPIQ